MSESTLVIGVGTNLGGRRSILRAARDLVAARFGASDLRVAPVWETPPMGPPQPDYLNTAFALELVGTLASALEQCIDIERSLGRERRQRWGARTLDLDLLWHAREHCHGPSLTIPHEGLRGRTFALDPLLALVPSAVDPTDGTLLAAVRATLPAGRAGTPLGDDFETHGTGDRGVVVRADDRADGYAAAAEAIGARMVAPRSVHPRASLLLEQHWTDRLTEEARLGTWLAAVSARLDDGQFALRRVAVLVDSPGLTRAVLLGEHRDENRHEIREYLGPFAHRRLEVETGAGCGWTARFAFDG